MNKRIASAVVGASLVFGLAACSDTASDDFKARCKAAGGEVKRDHDVLGMSAVAFTTKGGGGRGGSKSGGSKSSKSGKSKSSKKSSGKVSGSGGTKSKSKPADDNEWVCAKNGVELFDES